MTEPEFKVKPFIPVRPHPDTVESLKQDLELAQAQRKDIDLRIRALQKAIFALENPPRYAQVLGAMQSTETLLGAATSFTPMQLSKLTAEGYAAIQSMLRELEAKGLVERPTRGYYRLTEAGRKYGK